MYPNPATDPWPTLKPIPDYPPPLNLDTFEGLTFLVSMACRMLRQPFPKGCTRACKTPSAPALLPPSWPGVQRNYWNNPANGRTTIKRTLVHMLSGQLTVGGEGCQPQAHPAGPGLLATAQSAPGPGVAARSRPLRVGAGVAYRGAICDSHANPTRPDLVADYGFTGWIHNQFDWSGSPVSPPARSTLAASQRPTPCCTPRAAHGRACMPPRLSLCTLCCACLAE